MNNWFALVGCVILFSACTDTAVYRDSAVFSAQEWHQDSAVTFQVEVTDTIGKYRILIDLRNNSNYPYSNLFLFRQIESKQGVEFADTAQYLLADRQGKWLGKGSGAIKSSTFSFKAQALRFTKMGTYTFTLQHGMRDIYLKGVEDIGLRIIPEEIH